MPWVCDEDCEHRCSGGCGRTMNARRLRRVGGRWYCTDCLEFTNTATTTRSRAGGLED